jgi:phage terminase large subunit-like protein
VTSKRLRHNGDPRLARHLENAQLKVDTRGSRLQKDAANSPRKIDLAVASVMALDRADFWLNEPGPDDYVWKDSAGAVHSQRVESIGFVY